MSVSRKNIAIIGSGTAGLASAIQLHNNRHQVTLFERFEEPQAIGAGILLQPSGLYVLKSIGLLDQIRSVGSQIDAVRGFNQYGKTVMDLWYRDFKRYLYGVGIHRGQLFQILFNHAKEIGVNIVLGVEVEELSQLSKGHELIANGQKYSFDAIILSDGARSKTRRFLRVKQQAFEYPWGALWKIVEKRPEVNMHELQHCFYKTKKLVGVLPTGIHPQSGEQCVSFYDGIEMNQLDKWYSQTDLTNWQNSLAKLWPVTKNLVTQINSHEDMIAASYVNVSMKRWNDRNLVCIGDAAHGTNPQLGQGANLALFDSWELVHQLELHDSIETAFDEYSKIRMSSLKYYQYTSRFLTLFFQSNYSLLGTLRDTGLPMAQKVKFTYRELLATICGVKGGWIGRLPADKTREVLRGLKD